MNGCVQGFSLPRAAMPRDGAGYRAHGEIYGIPERDSGGDEGKPARTVLLRLGLLAVIELRPSTSHVTVTRA